jgi:predicted nucleic acid-binding Zn ribbon protein
MKPKKIWKGRYRVRICLICGDELEEYQHKHCKKCARKYNLEKRRQKDIRRYWRKKGAMPPNNYTHPMKE